METQTQVNEYQALETLVKLSQSAVKRSRLEQRLKDGVLNALERFAADFLQDYKIKVYGDGDEVSRYEMAYRIVNCSDSPDLDALWYIFYPYLVVSAPHIDTELYSLTAQKLSAEENLKNVLESRYCELIYDSEQDLLAAGLAGVYSEWYAPYADYKNGSGSSGLSRETEKYQRLLALGKFEQVITGTERMLNYNPFDYETALTNIAARVSLLGKGSEDDRAAALNGTVQFINGLLDSCTDTRQLTYMHYYRALCYLGLTAFDGTLIKDVEDEFDICLELTPDFELVHLMRNAINEKLKER